jgi:sulfite exporter TauE/SafE/copper chaperone CopZ
MKKTFSINGMHCNSCANTIERALKDKVESISVSYVKSTAQIEYNPQKITEEEIKKIIEKEGYSCSCELESNSSKNKITFEKIGPILLSILGVLIFLVLLYKLTGFNIPQISIPSIGQSTSLALLFLIGILTGFHCVSMCGGFVLSYTSKNALAGYKGFSQHIIYGLSKTVSYTIIGGIFGLIGGLFSFTPIFRGTVAILAGLFMIFYALSMFGFSFFRRFQFKSNLLINMQNKIPQGKYSRPLFIGLLNGLFIACGPLQAMYLYAAGTGSAISGAISLAAFGLGTIPVMLIFGSLATIISHKTTGKILKISAIIVLVLGLIMLNRGLNLTGSSLSFESIKTSIIGTGAISQTQNSQVNIINGVQEVNMDVTSSGYSPNSFVIKKGVPVKWNINVKELTSCNNEILLNQYNLDVKLKKGLNVITFTPDKEGTLSFTCWMGMLRGSFIVTQDGTASQQQVAAATPKSSGSCNMGSGGSCGGSCGGGCGCGGSK